MYSIYNSEDINNVVLFWYNGVIVHSVPAVTVTLIEYQSLDVSYLA